MTSQLPKRIDLHSHFLPDFYQTACRENGHSNPDGMPFLPAWTPEEHMAMMDRIGISKSILSISTPGTHLTPGEDEEARRLTRRVNLFASQLKTQHPTRFGYFARLPLPDVAGSLSEIPSAEEEGCDGFVVETNHHGHYLGDPIFDPVFDELNRRRALVFIHPTTPKKCPCSGAAAAAAAPVPGGRGGGKGEEGKPLHATPLETKFVNPMLEFFFDTARVVTNLFLSGTMRRCPDVRFVLPHLGGAFPPLLSRWTGFSTLVPIPGMEAVTEAEVTEVLAERVWFDLAGFPFPSQIRGLMAGVGVAASRIVYGSDFPFTQVGGVELLRDQMDKGVREIFGEDEIRDVYYRNAERLLVKK